MSTDPQRVFPSALHPKSHSLCYRRPLATSALKASTSLPFLIHYHTMSNKDSGNMCLGSQSSDRTDAAVTSFQNTHRFDYSKVRLLYLLSVQLMMEHRILITQCKSTRTRPNCFSLLPHIAFPLSVAIYILQ